MTQIRTPTPTKSNENEIRMMDIGEVRQLTNESGNYTQIEGYAIKYNKRSSIMTDFWGDKWVERFAAGAFTESLSERNQKALWNHDWGKPLGSVKAGTLRLSDSLEGLQYTIDIPGNSWGNDAAESIGRGDTDGTSFGFRAIEDMWEIITLDGEEIYQRTILKANLYEVSPCTLPAYPDTTSEARSLRCRDMVKKDDSRERVLLTLETLI